MDTHTNYISLYAGGGGLDLGFKLANPDARAVCYVEREAHSIALLVDHMQSGQLDDAPLWSDSGTFDGKPWRSKVDFLIGGFPCQPFSVSGKQKRFEDDRWLWPDIAGIIREVQPIGLFLENVPPLISGGGLAEVLRDLAELGFDAEWDLFRASDVGASHRRERVFILAHRSSERLGEARQHIERPPERPAGEIGTLGDSDHTGLQGWRRYGERGNELPAWPPGPADNDAWSRILFDRQDLAPAVGDSSGDHEQRDRKPGTERATRNNRSAPSRRRGSEIYRSQETKPEVRGMVNGLAPGLARADRLRILGNGVVPQQAALAFEHLATRMNLNQFYKRA